MPKLNVLIAGCTGYIGIELVKLLIKHKRVTIKYLCGSSSIGKKISNFDNTIKKKLPKIIKFDKSKLKEVDVIFTALPNGEAQKISKYLLKNNILIDIAADFRLTANEYFKWYKIKHKAPISIKKSIYLLPELNDKDLSKYQIIACPGCYPTSILLPLKPLIEKKMINFSNIVIDSKSGYSGAGRGVHKKYYKKNLNESLSAYGLNNHRHNPEIEKELNKSANKKIYFDFTPHLTPMFRGILTTIYVDIKKNMNKDKVFKYLKNYYKNQPFIKIMKDSFLSTNDVINTNFCNISVCNSKNKNKLIILSSIDNLIKGGSGQAIQNMNKKFNFPVKMGLI
ncbi:N-acetyl-gamma-glutamyl-phosphate reductase [Pelagibacterales bacterium SAG-MED15]|nr:N-acetyl-gamma-glutamyl-phosphate reductase [Pelagibacterales bacterium SAG-MED15]